VMGWSRTAKDVPDLVINSGKDGLAAFLGQADILVCLLPLTRETSGIINYELLRQLKRTGPLGAPILINAGRGMQQVGADILRALGDGTLAGASLDVFETEPLPASSPFWSHPKVVITPHVAADSDPDAMTAFALAQLARHEAGGTMDNVVDRLRGY